MAAAQHSPTQQPKSSFTGAFARFPNLSALPERQQRITLVAIWNNDAFPSYLRHFFYTAQLNAAKLDLLMINRRIESGDQCLDFAKNNVDITWGGNIQYHCLDDDEFHRRHVDFLCSAEHGWNCDEQKYDAVHKQFRPRPDVLNVNFKPLHGYIFRDLFANPENPLWAWIDMDSFLGDFARFPLNILSQVSYISGSHDQPSSLYLAGQLTAWNLDDPNLATAWMKFPAFESADAFLEKGFNRNAKEEKVWSYLYTQSEDGLPGSNLSYVLIPEFQGDDYYSKKWMPKHAAEAYIISGKEIILASESYSREEIEGLIRLERETPVDDLGGIGWTGGEDGSAYLLENPDLDPTEAKSLAVANASKSQDTVAIHQGIVEDVKILTTECLPDHRLEYQCVPVHPLQAVEPPILTSTLIRFREQKPMHMIRRLEKDHRPRGYQRKIMKHHSRVKKLPWFTFPSFDITDELVLRMGSDFIEVWKMGSTRNETLYSRTLPKRS